MATKKKNFWYVLVMTETGPTFVTDVNHRDKTAEWDKDGSPLEMSESEAKDLAIGLQLNYHLSYAICNAYALDSQPYHYEFGEFVWKQEGEWIKENPTRYLCPFCKSQRMVWTHKYCGVCGAKLSEQAEDSKNKEEN